MADKIYVMLRWRTAFIALLCVAWFALGYWLFRYGLFVKSVPMGFLTMVVAGCYLAVYGMLTLLPTRLTLTDEGFDLRHWTGRDRVAWRDIAPLEVSGAGSSSMVTYSYLPGRLPGKLSLLHRINHRMGSFDGSLPSNLPVRSETLCAEMNTCRERAAGPTAGPSPRSG